MFSVMSVCSWGQGVPIPRHHGIEILSHPPKESGLEGLAREGLTLPCTRSSTIASGGWGTWVVCLVLEGFLGLFTTLLRL